jgi:hypothetical protein
MWEIVLGALVVIGIFVFWCDVTDAWNNVFRRNKYWKTAHFSPLIQSSPLPTRELRFNIRGGAAQHHCVFPFIHSTYPQRILRGVGHSISIIAMCGSG